MAERFIEGVVEGAKALRVGDPMDWETEIGPMVSQEQLETVRELVDDAVANGATLHCGGARAQPGSSRPAVLTGVTHDMRIMREEIFGPVVPIVTVEDEDEAIALANDSEFGLGASVWTMNRAKGERIAAPARVRHGLGERPHVLPRRLLVLVGRREELRASAARTRSSACTSA